LFQLELGLAPLEFGAGAEVQVQIRAVGHLQLPAATTATPPGATARGNIDNQPNLAVKNHHLTQQLLARRRPVLGQISTPVQGERVSDPYPARLDYAAP
jgi:hypothetical protein